MSKDKIPFFHNLIATGFGSGYSPIAPGTAGALLATLIWWGYESLVASYWPTFFITSALVIIFTVLGIWSSTVSEKYWGEDPSRVVIDEMVGTWIALLAVPANAHWGYIIAAFILFRFFDILKPFGIRKMEKFPKGYGIMADDILSGIYGFIIIILFRIIFE
ncbi:phosphatidylglycerophosphatase A [uncultured Bacteroides sp.]|uniref:phosphatidylglycerophosphatase A family protein n=1 Tax=uncultured Bacteroides sp. TaxID=162156 RepID=UPI00260CE496|nr:phosphatidylglycerophosphatase A [uncultured Bacteroides sp.]